MSTISCEDQLAQFQQFRQDIYTNFPLNRDSLMDLLDAVTGNITALASSRIMRASFFPSRL